MNIEQPQEWVPKWNGEYFNVSIDDATKLDEDPRFRELLEEESYKWLESNDSEWFIKNYSGVAESGYLLDVKGNETDILPSQCINNIDAVKQTVTAAFAERFPEDAAWYKLDMLGKKAA